MALGDLIEEAIAGSGMRHDFQPLWDLRNGQLLGFEALARFRDGTPPDRVWSVARAQGMGVALDRVSARAALAAGAHLPGRLFVNLSAATLAAPATARYGKDMVRSRRHRRLVLEITEDAVHASERVETRIRQLLRARVPLALDDAGSGSATHERLALLAPDLAYVKIDRAVVQAWLLTGRGPLPLWVSWATEICTPCIAEGVEDPDAASYLLRAGIAYGQGFAFGAPAPAASWDRQRLARAQPCPHVTFSG